MPVESELLLTYPVTRPGSDGYFFGYLFMSKVELTRGALNVIRDKASAMGGDSVFILRDQAPVFNDHDFYRRCI